MERQEACLIREVETVWQFLIRIEDIIEENRQEKVYYNMLMVELSDKTNILDSTYEEIKSFLSIFNICGHIVCNNIYKTKHLNFYTYLHLIN